MTKRKITLLLALLVAHIPLMAEGTITFTTEKAIGTKIFLELDNPIEIDGVQEAPVSDEKMARGYTITKQTITIKGDLKFLSINFGKLTSLDVTKCPTLERLSCNDNPKLTTLDVSPLSNLLYLSMARCAIESIDISKSKGLKTLIIEDNQISTIDLSNNPDIVVLRMNRNKVASLAFPSGSALEEVYVSGNMLTAVDFSNCANLRIANVINNQISGKNMDNLIASLPTYKVNDGQYVGVFADPTSGYKDKNVCTVKQVAAIKAKGFIAKTYTNKGWKGYEGAEEQPIQGGLSFTTEKKVGEKIAFGIVYNGDLVTEGLTGELVSDGKIRTYEITNQNIVLKGDIESLQITHQKLTNINVKGCTNLVALVCSTNQLASLDLSGLAKLKNVMAHTNEISSINLSGCGELQSLALGDNKIPDIDLSSNAKLQDLRLNRNKLSTIDLSHTPELHTVYISGNNLKRIDFSHCPKLTRANILLNDIKGEDMDAVIASLPTYKVSDGQWIGVVGHESAGYGNEKNVCTVKQVAAIKAKGFEPRIYTSSGWKPYEGSPTGAEIIETNEKRVVARYSINGEVLQSPQEGINIVVYSDGTTGKIFLSPSEI